ncbi:MAG TPA: hypothetical protein VI791_00395 [Patescibacteria group bacterium]|nr:hypothetical protein [Patescibacteria group bacterium]
MALTDGDLKKIGKLMDERLLVFHNDVTEKKFEWLEETLGNRITKVESKLDKITDHQAEMLDNHERRIGKLELSVAI